MKVRTTVAGRYRHEDGTGLYFCLVQTGKGQLVPSATFIFGKTRLPQGQWDLRRLVALVREPGWTQLQPMDPRVVEMEEAEMLARHLDEDEDRSSGLGERDYLSPWPIGTESKNGM